MKKNVAIYITALTLLAALTFPIRIHGQLEKQTHHHYKLIDLGSTFGGPQSYVNAGSGNEFANFALILNNQGTVAGYADTSMPDPFPAFCFNEDCSASHAFQWKNGVTTDLGALPGGASSASNWISPNGLIAGFSENGEIDPLVRGLPEVRGVLWQNGAITDLGTLPEGGFESIANAVNSNGQVVGLAVNATPDPDSMLGLGYQTRAFLWQQGAMQDLGTLGTGTDAQAILINERGQVVGWSYTSLAASPLCMFPLATGSFIWDKQKGMKELGNLGGTCTIATDGNDRGQVVGASNLSGDLSQHAFVWDNGSFQDLGGSLGGDFLGAFAINHAGQAVGFAYLPGDTVFHASLWKQVGQLTDLGAIGGDQCSFATGINNELQIVGGSGDCVSSFRAFLWEDGSMFDLNTLIPPGSNLQLQFVETINDRGEIAGTGIDSIGNEHAFLLIPCDPGSPSQCEEEFADTNRTEQASAAAAMPKPQMSGRNSIRQMLRRRLGAGPNLLTPTRAASGKESAQAGPTSTGGIVYTPTNVTISGDGSIKLDLNHDGITDFTITASDGYSMCYFANEFHGTDTLFPATGNGVVASNGSVAALGSGTLVGSSDSFQTTQTLIGSFVFGPGFPPCLSYLRGWCHGTISSKSCSGTAYMGLEFKINGQVHYGWAYLEIYAAAPGTFNTTLKGFAYETVAGRAITTGQTSGY